MIKNKSDNKRITVTDLVKTSDGQLTYDDSESDPLKPLVTKDVSDGYREFKNKSYRNWPWTDVAGVYDRPTAVIDTTLDNTQ